MTAGEANEEPFPARPVDEYPWTSIGLDGPAVAGEPEVVVVVGEDSLGLAAVPAAGVDKVAAAGSTVEVVTEDPGVAAWEAAAGAMAKRVATIEVAMSFHAIPDVGALFAVVCLPGRRSSCISWALLFVFDS